METGIPNIFIGSFIFSNPHFRLDSVILQKSMFSTQIPILQSYESASLDSAFQALRAEVAEETATLRTSEDREQFRLHWLGRKQGRLKHISDAWLKTAPAEARKALGVHFNQLKQEIEKALYAESPAGPSETAMSGGLDITLPGIRPAIGAEHPLIRTMNEIVGIFTRIGYSVGVGAGGRNRLLQFRVTELSPESSGARHAGYAGHRQPGS